MVQGKEDWEGGRRGGLEVILSWLSRKELKEIKEGSMLSFGEGAFSAETSARAKSL